MMQELQCILVQVIPNLCERRRSINIFLHVVILIPRAEVVYIPHHWYCGLRLNDQLIMLCVIVCILVIRIIVIVIFTWQEGKYNVLVYLVL